MFEVVDRTDLPLDAEGRLLTGKPFYPLDSVGMPKPGPDFLEHAEQLAGADAVEAAVEQLYRLALYSQGDFFLPVRTKYGYRPAYFLPGHRWADKASGPVPSRVLVVGKMPGADEAERKRNFCGPSGQLLRQVAEASGADPREWYVTNVVRFVPPDGGKTVTSRWVNDCLPLLHEELRLVRPDYILCLGSEAAKAMLGRHASVGRCSGRVTDYRIQLPGDNGDATEHVARMLVSLHPAAVLHDSSQLPQLEQSIRLFARLVSGEFSGHVETDIDHRVIRDEATLAKLVDELLADDTTKVLSFDCEWHGDAPTEPDSYLRTIQFSWKAKHAACVVLRKQGGDWVFQGDARGQLCRLIARIGTRIVGYFLRSDIPWLEHFGIPITAAFLAPVDDLDMSAPGARYGWEKTKDEGGFDVSLAIHAVRETGPFGLEVSSSLYTTVPRYDLPMEEWKRDFCKEHKIKPKDLGGFGEAPDELIHNYGMYDADAPRRMFDVFNEKRLDCDEYGNNCRKSFWISMRATEALLEMEHTGLLIDQGRVKELTSHYAEANRQLLAQLREWSHWPEFNPNSAYHCREFLFGPDRSGKFDPETGKQLSVAPEGAWSLHATPIKTTGKPSRAWSEAKKDKGQPATPSTDKEVLGILSSDYEQAGWLRNIRFLGQVLKSVLCPPKIRAVERAIPVEAAGDDDDFETELEEYHDKGLLSFVRSDGRIHPSIRQTLETSRGASSKPNMMALAKRRETQYQALLGDKYCGSIRSTIVAPEDYRLVEADFVGAELAVMAWESGDKAMIDHVARSALPEDHPEHYDMHSQLAVKAFRLDCLPTKAGLKTIGRANLRVAAKSVKFGRPYGRGATAIQRSIAEEGVKITLEETEQLLAAECDQYPDLTAFFDRCSARASDPGWICGPFGRIRRARPAQNEEQLAELERQFKNFPIQNGVADALWQALDHLYSSPEHRAGKFKILLQIHDAVLFLVRREFVVEICQETIPRCLCRMVPFVPRDLSGRLLQSGPYYFGVDVQIGQRWGEELPKAELASLGFAS